MTCRWPFEDCDCSSCVRDGAPRRAVEPMKLRSRTLVEPGDRVMNFEPGEFFPGRPQPETPQAVHIAARGEQVALCGEQIAKRTELGLTFTKVGGLFFIAPVILLGADPEAEARRVQVHATCTTCRGAYEFNNSPAIRRLRDVPPRPPRLARLRSWLKKLLRRKS